MYAQTKPQPNTTLFSTEIDGVLAANSTELHNLEHGERFELRIAPIVKALGAERVRMLAYNGSVPGPTLRVEQGSEIEVQVLNEGDLEATVHWHGLRLENRYDGTTLTQPPIQIGGRFSYRLAFPDPGVYWYHPHIREDYAQEMGLYGNIIVVPSEPDYWPRVHRELALVLDDVLLEGGAVAPFRRSETTHVAMGRFGNVLLANGETELALRAQSNEIVRFYLTNTASARVFKLAIPGAEMKLVGGDSGRIEQERFVESVTLAPSERAVVDVLFKAPGRHVLEHRTPQRTYALASIEVASDFATPSLVAEFGVLRTNADLANERAQIARALLAEPDKTLEFVAEMDLGAADATGDAEESYFCPMHPEIESDKADRCPECGMKLIPTRFRTAANEPGVHTGSHTGSQDHGHEGHAHDTSAQSDGIEWEDDMLDVNRLTTPKNTRWKLIDRATGAEGQAIDWRFRVGDRVKIRLVNQMDSDHPMHHPFHVHGAGRFIILSRDGVPEPNLAWKDTVLVPTGQVVDILLEISNAGSWMAHCHISEHHESGMMLTFEVTR